MNQYRQFVFEDYDFDAAKKLLTLRYSMDGQLDLTETYKFDFDFVAYDNHVLDRALQNLFFMVGVSYYKMFIPPEIVIKRGQLDADMAAFFSKTYQRGLGEFWYVNQLDPKTPVIFPHNTELVHPVLPPRAHIDIAKQSGSFLDRPGVAERPVLTPDKPAEDKTIHDKLIIGIGGGKDSLVSVELLRGQIADLATWSVNHRPQLTPLIERIGLPHFWVERQWDPQLIEHKERGGLNGHVPISAILACVGTVVGVLSGRSDNVVSNESSTSEPTLHYQDVAINHQYSKSLEFEKDYQALLRHCFNGNQRYYSLLRPLTELHIASIFSRIGFNKYKDVFSSCNRAYVHGSDHMSWCGTCPKCAFVFLALTPFVERKNLEALFGGKNLLLDPALERTYKQLLGIEGDKPMECVGEIKESRAAMQLAQQQYLDLLEYHFDLPANYDYRTLGPSSMPEQMLRLLISRI